MLTSTFPVLCFTSHTSRKHKPFNPLNSYVSFLVTAAWCSISSVGFTVVGVQTSGFAQHRIIAGSCITHAIYLPHSRELRLVAPFTITVWLVIKSHPILRTCVMLYLVHHS